MDGGGGGVATVYLIIIRLTSLISLSLFPPPDKEFPSTFESVVKKIMKLLYHVIAHIYHSHFKEIVLLNLHPHLNCIFAHIVLFNEGFKLIDEKELEVLNDLAVALRLYPPSNSPNSGTMGGATTPTIAATTSHCDDEISGPSESGVGGGGGSGPNDDNNNNHSMGSEYEQVITTQCRSISAFDNYKNYTMEENLVVDDGSDMKENDGGGSSGSNSAACLADMHLVNSPMLVDETDEEGIKPADHHHSYLVASSPEPMMIEPMTSSENIPKKYILESSNLFRVRSISANAVLSSSKSLDTFPISTITRRCNSDRSSVKSYNLPHTSVAAATSAAVATAAMQQRNHLFQANYDNRTTTTTTTTWGR